MGDGDIGLLIGGALVLFGGAWWAIRRAGRQLRELTGHREGSTASEREAAFLMAMQAAARRQREQTGHEAGRRGTGDAPPT